MPTQLSETTLQFLRALRGGRIDSSQIAERYKSRHPNIGALIEAGLIRVVSQGGMSIQAQRPSSRAKRRLAADSPHRVYEITDAGRAACPPRNPLSTQPRPKPAPRGDDVRGPTGGHSARRHGRVVPEIAL